MLLCRLRCQGCCAGRAVQIALCFCTHTGWNTTTCGCESGSLNSTDSVFLGSRHSKWHRGFRHRSMLCCIRRMRLVAAGEHSEQQLHCLLQQLRHLLQQLRCFQQQHSCCPVLLVCRLVKRQLLPCCVLLCKRQCQPCCAGCVAAGVPKTPAEWQSRLF